MIAPAASSVVYTQAPAVEYVQAPQVVQTVAAPAAPLPPQPLTTGMPDPNAIQKQKAAYAKMLDDQLKQGTDVLNSQLKYQKEYLAAQAEQQKQTFLMQLDQQVKQTDFQLQQQYTQQLASLQQQAAQQKAALEQQSMQLTGWIAAQCFLYLQNFWVFLFFQSERREGLFFMALCPRWFMPLAFLPVAVRPRSSLCLCLAPTIQLMRGSLLIALCWGSIRMTSKNLKLASWPTQ